MSAQPNHNLLRILLVEDSMLARVTYRRYLQEQPSPSYQFIEAETLTKGLQLWESEKPDLVLLDLQLPDGHGIEFLETIQAGLPERPVIVLTGQGDEHSAVQCMKLGAADYLVKSGLTAALLRSCIEQVRETTLLTRQLARSQKQKELLSEIALRIRQSLDLSQILQSAVEGVRQLLDCDRAIIYQFQPNWSGQVIVESVSCEDLSILNREICDPGFISQRLDLYQQGQTTQVQDRDQDDLQPAYREWLASLQVRAHLVTPLFQDEQLWGLLVAHECQLPRAWESLDIHWVQQLATQVSIAIQQASAYTKLQQLNYELEARVNQRTAALQQSEARLQDAQRIAHLGHWEIDLSTHRLTGSPEFFQIFGLDPGQQAVRYDDFLQLFSDPIRDHIHRVVYQAMQERKPYELALPFTRQNGVPGYVLLRGTPIYNSQGEVLRRVGIVMDISELKTAEAQLHFQAAILQNIRDAVISMDPHGLIESWNHGAEEIFGYSASEVLGQSVATLYERPEELEAVLTALRTSDRHEVEVACRSKSGDRVYVHLRLSVSRDQQGNLIRLLGVSNDISTTKQAEAVRQQFEAQLQKTNQELARATRLKDEFLANMSHELRTPLNAILGMSEALRDQIFGELNEQQQQALETVENSGQHLLELINDILDLAKISSGKSELCLTAVSAQMLCSSSLVFIKHQAAQKNLKIHSDVPASLREIWVDERRIRQVLINLLMNAVKFTPEGGAVDLKVAFGCQDNWQGAATIPPALATQSSPIVIFQVTDTGIGISHADLPHLFQPFLQVDSSLNRQYQGTGLGLAMVKQITELHGGQVLVDSQPGQGSCFTIALPDNRLPLPASLPEPTRLSDLGSGGNCQQQSLSILLAEDNESNIATFVAYLSNCNYQVISARTGVEAVALAKIHQPDVILMDIQMPEMDGLEAIRLIRQDERLITVPIIALTALAMPGDEEQCLQAGANQYLSKPVRLKQLKQAIATLCSAPA